MASAWNDDAGDMWYELTREQVWRGKRPQRSKCFRVNASSTTRRNAHTPFAPQNNSEEWLGLKYASKIDCHPAIVENPCGSTGEYLKSRKSWAALHRRYADPALEEQHDQEWQLWHLELECKEQGRRTQRTLNFWKVSEEQSALHFHEHALVSWIASKKEAGMLDEHDRCLLESAEQQLALIEEYKRITYPMPSTNRDRGNRSLRVRFAETTGTTVGGW
ncbi:hypothetical protein LXA43DRAFT_601540 [Ganoderma leucocontextum]|nr:hypothetical protein LXA43DRAFT_601540 [Ganoderma leucocontextum]